jgi:hypothetical protein
MSTILLVLLTSACGPVAGLTHSVITTDRNGLRTFSVITELDGNPVVWPGGFTVRFEPTVTLIDDHGKAVASGGAKVTLDQVKPDSHAGTFEDPYIASGGLFDGCYPYIA